MTVRIQKCLCFPAPPTPPLLPACLCWPTWPQPQYLLPRCLLLFLNLVAINHYHSLCAVEIISITFTGTLIKSCCIIASSLLSLIVRHPLQELRLACIESWSFS